MAPAEAPSPPSAASLGAGKWKKAEPPSVKKSSSAVGRRRYLNSPTRAGVCYGAVHMHRTATCLSAYFKHL